MARSFIFKPMHTGAALSTRVDGRAAAIEATLEAATNFPSAPDLAVVFASPHFTDQAEMVLDAVHEGAGPRTVIGCVGEAIVAQNKEVESNPAIAVWLAALPAPVTTFRADFDRDSSTFSGWPQADPGAYLMIADPYTFPADHLLKQVNQEQPGTVIIGGMASGAAGPGGSRLFHDHAVLTSGAVGVRLPYDTEVLPLVSQGCRPIGRTFTVTKAEGNVIFELAGRPALHRVRETLDQLDAHERELVSAGLLLGRVIDEYKSEFERGDFLVRGVIGADARNGAIAVADEVALGETIQFHVRDAESADEDLRLMLEVAQGRMGDRPPAGALLFTCNGRGSRMFDQPDHDAGLVSSRLGGLPLAGFFCAGELGPIGGKNWLHGFTASLALFRDRYSSDGDDSAAPAE